MCVLSKCHLRLDHTRAAGARLLTTHSIHCYTPSLHAAPLSCKCPQGTAVMQGGEESDGGPAQRRRNGSRHGRDHAWQVPSGGCLPRTNGRAFYPQQLAGHAGCCPRQQQRRMPPETAPVRACIQKTLVAGTCASQQFLVAFFMRRYVSACGTSGAASAGGAFSMQNATPPLPTTHYSADWQVLNA